MMLKKPLILIASPVVIKVSSKYSKIKTINQFYNIEIVDVIVQKE